MPELNFPKEIIELPSKGLIYPKDHPLRSGKVEMKYMTALEEDILTNENYIEQKTVFDKVLESMTMKKFDIYDIHPGDKNALTISARILGYGSDYSFKHKGKTIDVNLSNLENKPFNIELTEQGTSFYELPNSGVKVEFKFLTEKETNQIEKDLKAEQRFRPEVGEVTARLKRLIVSINGDNDKSKISTFSEQMLASDSRALRNYIKDNSPDIDMNIKVGDEEVAIPIDLNFFWPDLKFDI
jgi:hypothetical protein